LLSPISDIFGAAPEVIRTTVTLPRYTHMDTLDLLPQVLDRLTRVEALLVDLVRQRAAKEFYSTDEVALILGKAKFTVREWCRHGRVHCRKKNNGRGKYQSWTISHEELLRIQREGLLPIETVLPSIN
jgi:helix-turn-helix protein